MTKENNEDINFGLEQLVKQPEMLTISPTHKCTAECEHCCLNCNPRISERLSLNEMKRIVDEAISNFETIKVLIITGGECFLIGNDLVQIVDYASSKGLATRVVTNGYWANTEKNAIERLRPLVDSGLKEINFSTGDNHQQFVPFENIVNGSIASITLNLKNVMIAVEGFSNSSFKVSDASQNARLKPFTEGLNPKIIIVSNFWVPFKKNNCVIPPQSIIETDNECTGIFNSLTINPKGQLLACCGLISEYTPYLKLGSIFENSMKKLYYKQFDDFIKILIFLEGPKKIIQTIMEKENIIINLPSKHTCHYCADILCQSDFKQLILKHYKPLAPEILFRYKVKLNFSL